MMGPLLSGFIKKHLADRASSMIAIYSMALALGAALGACGPLLTGFCMTARAISMKEYSKAKTECGWELEYPSWRTAFSKALS